MRNPTSVDLNGKVVIITGALGLLGSHFVRTCLEANARVVAVDIMDETSFNDAFSDISSHADNLMYVRCDITNEEMIDSLIKVTLNRWQEISALVNNAYPRNKNYGRKLEDVTYHDFCENVCLHLGGYFLTMKKVAEVMKHAGKGTIINMASIYGFKAPRFEIYENTDMTMPVEYAAIKAAIINLTKYFAVYYGKYGIRVNSISPGGVFNNQPSPFVEKYIQHVKIGNRMAIPQDISSMLVFLLSEHASYVTGQNIVVDGGWTL